MNGLYKFVTGTCLLLASLAFGGEGTLPFGKGQVPFSMAGSLITDAGVDQLKLNFRPERSLSIRESSACPSGMRDYNFGGAITIGGSRYQITAICARSNGLGRRVVSGRSGSASISLTGNLTADSRGTQRFEGRATVSGNGPSRSYQFKLSE